MTTAGFGHEALLYDDLDGFLAGTVPFLREGVGAGEPALVAVDPVKAEALRAALPEADGTVRYADMTELGRNPGRIISAWVDFAEEHAGAPRLRGIGEPVWPGRTAEEVAEAQRHEALLNLAFADHPGFVLVCPFDRAGLDEDVIAAAARTHPVVVHEGTRRSSPDYDPAVAPFAGDLPRPGPDAEVLDLASLRLSEVRRRVTERAASIGIDPDRATDLALAVTEATTNSLRHAGGGVLRLWHSPRALVCEVADGGRIEDPLAGRLPVPLDEASGRGLWLIHQLCDLVQVRSSETGSVVRMHLLR